MASQTAVNEKWAAVQRLIRAHYGAGRFASFASWSQRKLAHTEVDKTGRTVYVYRDGTRA